MLNADIRSVTLHADKKDQIVLKNIKFDIIEGKVYTILAKNGSGKSTLIKSITSLLPVDLYEVDGNVLFEETNLLQAPEKKLREIRKYLALAKDDAIVMHPGPLNRGVEISPEVADGPRSLILEQVANGVAVRMAVLLLLIGGDKG